MEAFNGKTLRYRPNHGPDFWSEENINTVIELWNLSPEMQHRLRDLKDRVADIDHFKNDPHILVRYLHGPWGHKEAENMFRKMVEWRKQHKIDSILDEYAPPPILLEAVPSSILQDYDREGDPVYVERGGAVDGVGLLKLFGKEEIVKAAIWSRERNSNGIWINDYERRTGRHPKGITIIYDLKGLSSKQLNAMSIDYFKDVMKLTKEYFPSPIKRMIIIRCPKIFSIAWGIVKHIFPAPARAKMIFLGNDYLDEVNKYVDINILPSCIYENGSGNVGVGMMQSLDGVEKLPETIDARQLTYPSPATSTTETDLESVCSEESFRSSVVTGKVLLRGFWKKRMDGNVEVARLQ